MNNGKQRILHAFPKELECDIRIIFDIINLSDKIDNGSTFGIQINEEKISIPERICCEEPSEHQIKNLTESQMNIINCYFTRHHNGYVRQRALRYIFKSDIKKWMIPYILRLTGEYVEEIIKDIYININLIKINDLNDFINTNKEFIQLNECRILSYWNEYYRTIDKHDYIGFKIIEKINYFNNELLYTGM